MQKKIRLGRSDYIVKSDSNIYRIRANGDIQRCGTGNPKSKYSYRKLSIGGKVRYLHNVMGDVFNGDVPEGKRITFKDGNKLNCRLDNLKLSTHNEISRKHFIKNKVGDHQEGVPVIVDEDIVFKSAKEAQKWFKAEGISKTIEPSYLYESIRLGKTTYLGHTIRALKAGK